MVEPPRDSRDAIGIQLARWADGLSATDARRLANRLSEIHFAAGQVRALIESLAEGSDTEASAVTLRKLRVWLVDELADLAAQVPSLLDPVSSELFERAPDDSTSS
jgi:hypothetical protein